MVNRYKTKQKLDKIIVLKYIEVKSLWKVNLNTTLNTDGTKSCELVIVAKLVWSFRSK